mgnify:CR=1 FL=1
MSKYNLTDIFEGMSNDEMSKAQEADRLEKVLRFRDCNNFEIPTNKNHIEDFVYLSKNQNLNNVVNSTLLKSMFFL